MPQPDYCPKMVYDIIIRCCNYDPIERPTFTKLVNELRNVIATLDAPFKKKRIGLNVTYVNVKHHLSLPNIKNRL